MSLKDNIRKRNIQLAETKKAAGMKLTPKEEKLLNSLKIKP